MYLLAARGAALLPTMRHHWEAVTALIAFVALLHLTLAMKYFSTPTKGDFRGIVSHVLSNKDYASYPVVGTRHAHYYDYYFKRFESDIRTDLVVMFGEDRAKLEDFAADAPNNSFWLLQAGIVAKPKPDLRDYLAANFETLEEFSSSRGRAALLRPRNAISE